MVRVRNMPKNHDRRFGRKTCAPGGCDSARARAELHVVGETARKQSRRLVGENVDVVALQAGVELEASKRRNRGGVIGLCMNSKGPPRLE